ncbi:MAG: 1-acyl-sn-glycerol-3-phosphate acyltransferase [Parachlamydia sp.]|jgi:glycerol-3-phosphate O-acyltransferase|nr:1-acyl-sn-glycerol-3-phosphate acyltransferase [Parachlamydia sp.]
MPQDLPGLLPYVREGFFSPSLKKTLHDFHSSYMQETRHSCAPEVADTLFQSLIELVADQVRNPYPFEIYHTAIRKPFDLYQFGLDFIRPLIDFNFSQVLGLKNLMNLIEQLERGENVILLSNHQTEPDPQIISLLLEKIDARLPSEMIFIAGHRVITDPIAVPLSLGRNLLCIFSKKYMSYPPEAKAEKVLHNQRTIKKMGQLLKEGGKCIYVAPSGGRDRKNENGRINVAPFDPQSLELFGLIASHADTPTHFYPLSLKTYDLMPPPQQIEKEIGEKRLARYSPVFMAIGEEIDWEATTYSEELNKKDRRDKRAEIIWSMVHKNYHLFP